MAKDTDSRSTAKNGKRVTMAIGRNKAERFAAANGMKKSAASKVLSAELSGRGLKGDAYRAAITKAFKKP